MQRAARFGQILSRLVPLSPMDVEEILCEQRGTRRPFGDIALRWGLCQPEHVWQAWATQLDAEPRAVDLEQLGIDVQAAQSMAPSLGRRLWIIPVRAAPDVLVIATPPGVRHEVLRRLFRESSRRVVFVTAPLEQIRSAVETHYGAAA